MSTQRVAVTFEGALLASYTDSRGVTYRLFRYDDEERGLFEEPRFFVHWEGEDGAWLEYAGGMGMTRAQVAQMWPELIEDFD